MIILLWGIYKMDSTILIYRMENSQGVGPFHGLFSHSLGDKRQEWIDCTKNMPILEEDNPHTGMFEYKNNPGMVSGCYHEKQILEWFNPFWFKLLAAGYNCNVYECLLSDVVLGDTQCVFDPNKAIN